MQAKRAAATPAPLTAAGERRAPSLLFRRAMQLYEQLGVVEPDPPGERARIESLRLLFKQCCGADGVIWRGKAPSGKGALHKLRRAHTGHDLSFMSIDRAEDFVYRLAGRLPDGKDKPTWYACENGGIYALLLGSDTRARLREHRSDPQKREALARFELEWVEFLRGQPESADAPTPQLPWEALARATAVVAARRPALRTTLDTLGTFVGRALDLRAVAGAFLDPSAPARLILVGEPGVGKTHLASEYGRQQVASYPGGTFLVPFDADPAQALARLVYPPGASVKDSARLALQTIDRPTLLIYDDVPSEAELTSWLPPPTLPVHVLVTTTCREWSGDHAVHFVDGLSDADGLALVEHLTDKALAVKYGAALTRFAAGVTMYLKPAALYADYEERRGRPVDLDLDASRGARERLQRAFEQLPVEGRLALRVAALFNPSRASLGGVSELLKGQGWSERRTERALDACIDRLWITPTSAGLRMHGLVAEFLRERTEPALPAPLRQRHWQDFLQLTRAFAEAPGDAELRMRLGAYPERIEVWEAIVEPASAEEYWSAGRGIIDLGRFVAARSWFERAAQRAEEQLAAGRGEVGAVSRAWHYAGMCWWALEDFVRARPCYERAVRAAEQGDAQGRVEFTRVAASQLQIGDRLRGLGQFEAALEYFHASVAASRKGNLAGVVDEADVGKGLHHIGYALWALERYPEALDYLERAVAAKGKGHSNGRLDSDSIGRSLHQVGECWWKLGEIGRARDAFVAAAAAKEKGEAHGRINHEHIGSSLHRIGDCWWSLNEVESARRVFEAAVERRQLGDVHGHIDHEALGSSLHCAGDCWLKLGQLELARQAYARAAEAKRKGDSLGVRDDLSLGRSLQAMTEVTARLGSRESA